MYMVSLPLLLLLLHDDDDDDDDDAADAYTELLPLKDDDLCASKQQ